MPDVIRSAEIFRFSVVDAAVESAKREAEAIQQIEIGDKAAADANRAAAIRSAVLGFNQ